MFTADELTIGEAAKNQIAMNVKKTVFIVKRLTRSGFSDPVVLEDMKHRFVLLSWRRGHAADPGRVQGRYKTIHSGDLVGGTDEDA